MEYWRKIADQLAGQRLPDGWVRVRSSRFARVACHSQEGIFYKEFLPRSPWEKFKSLLRSSRATRARRNGDALVTAGFNAPENLAWGALSGGREYLFTRAVPGRGLYYWLHTELIAGDLPSLHRRWLLMRELGDFIGCLHAAGFIHGDLSPSNVLADFNGSGFNFSLIDNERNVRTRLPLNKRLLSNLMQLNMLSSGLTRSDRWRFFYAWRRCMPKLSDADAKALAAEAYIRAVRRMRIRGEV